MDTNLLLLLLVGQLDPGLISSFGRTTEYTEDDFGLLVQILEPLGVAVTPHVLAETTNLGGGGLKGPRRQDFFAQLFEFLRVAEEVFVESLAAADLDPFLASRLGLTDSLLVLAAERGNRVVLTNDDDLTVVLVSRSIDVVKFDWLREL